MQERREFVDYVVELLGPFGTVRTRPMFGGHAVYLDGVVFAIVVDEALWFKADDINRAEFEAAGCDRFSYARGGRLASMSFYRAPPEAMESAAEALPWARTAYAAGLRAHAKRVAEEQRRAAAAAEAPAKKPVKPRGTTRTKATTATKGTPATRRPGGRAATRAGTRSPRKSAAKRGTRRR